MDRLTVAFVGRLLVSLVLALIGFMAVRYGYKLFVSGVGLKKDKGQLRFRAPQVKVEMVTSSFGGVLMLTSLSWGVLTCLSLQTLSPGRVAAHHPASPMIGFLLPTSPDTTGEPGPAFPHGPKTTAHATR